LQIGAYVFVAIMLVLWLFLISAPGLFVAIVCWRLSRDWQNVAGQICFRATVIAVGLAPSIYGHGDIVPAIFLAIGLSGRERMIGIVPILVVWLITVVVLAILAKRRKPNTEDLGLG
jgi:hypothetical protein